MTSEKEPSEKKSLIARSLTFIWSVCIHVTTITLVCGLLTAAAAIWGVQRSLQGAKEDNDRRFEVARLEDAYELLGAYKSWLFRLEAGLDKELQPPALRSQLEMEVRLYSDKLYESVKPFCDSADKFERPIDSLIRDVPKDSLYTIARGARKYDKQYQVRIGLVKACVAVFDSLKREKSK